MLQTRKGFAVTVLEVYNGSDGEATKRLYEELAQLGPIGEVALNLFRAQKCSARAKLYRRRAHKGDAYDRKNWSMANLCRVLEQHASALGITWGWKPDPAQEYHKWVLYVELPTGQASFHSASRGIGPDYPGDWDGIPDASAGRIVQWVAMVKGESRGVNSHTPRLRGDTVTGSPTGPLSGPAPGGPRAPASAAATVAPEQLRLV